MLARIAKHTGLTPKDLLVSGAVTPKRVAGSLQLPAPTPPAMRVRSGRFIAVILMAGHALAAGNASPGRVWRHAEVCSTPR